MVINNIEAGINGVLIIKAAIVKTIRIYTKIVANIGDINSNANKAIIGMRPIQEK